jgi:type VI secretion system protein ImpC
MRALLELRTALNAIKGPLGPVPSFKKMMVTALADEGSRRRLRREMGLDGEAPPAEADGSLIDAFLREAHIGPTFEGYATCRQGLEAFLAAMMTPPFAGGRLDKNVADALIADLDQRLSAQVNEVLHHPAFQRLEAAWRTLKFVVDRADFRENIRLEVLDCSKADLQIDFEDAPVVSRSGLYEHVYGAPYGASDGVPYGLIVADYTFGPTAEDVWLLTRCAAVAAAAHAPLLTGASPAMVGETSWGPGGDDLRRHFEAPAYARWQNFRDSGDARYVGLCLPRFLLRLPYGSCTVPVKSFNFEEDVVGRRERYLWGNAAAALAARAADSFAKYRWCTHIVGRRDGLVEGLPLHEYELEGEVCDACPVELRLTERQAHALSEEGFIGLTWLQDTGQAHFLTGEAAARCEHLDAQLTYLFVVTRLAQHLKVLHRQHGGRGLDASESRHVLQAWLSQYVSPADDPAPAVRSRRPLREASVTVEALREPPGACRFDLRVRPHFEPSGEPFTLSLVGKLDG